jgi:hypothetical protein
MGDLMGESEYQHIQAIIDREVERLERAGDGTMGAKPGEASDGRGKMTTGTVAVQPMTRRTGGVGAYGLYFEGRQVDGTILRAFLAAGVVGTSTLTLGAKGARWVLETEPNAQVAQAHVAGFFGVTEATAVPVELTGQDVGRLKRGVLTSAVYPLQEILSNTVDTAWEEVA